MCICTTCRRLHNVIGRIKAIVKPVQRTLIISTLEIAVCWKKISTIFLPLVYQRCTRKSRTKKKRRSVDSQQSKKCDPHDSKGLLGSSTDDNRNAPGQNPSSPNSTPKAGNKTTARKLSFISDHGAGAADSSHLEAKSLSGLPQCAMRRSPQTDFDKNALPMALGWLKEEVIHRRDDCQHVVSSHQRQREEQELSKLQKFVEGNIFSGICSLAIVINSVTIGFGTEWSVQHPGEPTPQGARITDLFFNSFFLFELVMRLVTMRLRFFFSPDWRWNIFDFVVVFLAVLDEVVNLVGGSAAATNVTFIRILRVLRLARIMRTVRVLRFCRELRLMVYSILECANLVAWSTVLILLVIYVFAVHFTQHVADVLGIPTDDPEVAANNDDLRTYYGSLGQSILSLFQGITGGVDWGDLVNPLMKSSPMPVYFGMVFTVYILFTVMALLNVLTGIFVDNAMKATENDKDMVIQDEMERQSSYLNDVKQMFREADVDKSGDLSWEEFENHLEDARVKAYFKSLELDASAARGLFKLLDQDGTGHIDIDEFMMGCMRLKGQAKSIDIATLMYENKRLVGKWNKFMKYCEEQFGEILGGHDKIQQAHNTLHRTLKSKGEIASFQNNLVVAADELPLPLPPALPRPQGTVSRNAPIAMNGEPALKV